jgi:hypothetical protein
VEIREYFWFAEASSARRERDQDGNMKISDPNYVDMGPRRVTYQTPIVHAGNKQFANDDFWSWWSVQIAAL